MSQHVICSYVTTIMATLLLSKQFCDYVCEVVAKAKVSMKKYQQNSVLTEVHVHMGMDNVYVTKPKFTLCIG